MLIMKLSLKMKQTVAKPIIPYDFRSSKFNLNVKKKKTKMNYKQIPIRMKSQFSRLMEIMDVIYPSLKLYSD